MLMCAAFLALLAAGCDFDLNQVPEAVRTAFENKYPDVRRVEWEFELGSYKAEFHEGTTESEAWFSRGGEWIRTKQEIPYQQVPEAVKQAAMDYAGRKWQVEDIDRWLQPVDPGEYYTVEFEKAWIDVDKDVRFLPDGTRL